jgi:hypothetical protein
VLQVLDFAGVLTPGAVSAVSVNTDPDSRPDRPDSELDISTVGDTAP